LTGQASKSCQISAQGGHSLSGRKLWYILRWLIQWNAANVARLSHTSKGNVDIINHDLEKNHQRIDKEILEKP